MLGLHFVDGARTASIVLGLSVIIFFVVIGVSKAVRSPRRRRFRSAYPFGGPYWNRGFDLADPIRQLHAVEAASFQKQRVLSGSEYRVFKIIEDEVATLGKGHRVFAQTSLGEILKSSDRDAFHSINSKRADILVVDGGGWPVLAVEYQGEGHFQNTAATRDAIKKEALRKAGVRHLEVHPADSDDDIRSRVRGQLGWKAAPLSRREPKPYVTPPLPNVIMDCRVKPGNDQGEAARSR
jgi:Protein of unknown function (DUF2726)